MRELIDSVLDYIHIELAKARKNGWPDGQKDVLIALARALEQAIKAA